MSPDHHFHSLTQQVCHLLACNSAHLILGCPEYGLRHPLLDLYMAPALYKPIASYGSSIAAALSLLQDEHIRALCDTALQTGHIQSIDHFHAHDKAMQSLCLVPLERPAGLLGLLILTDSHRAAFAAGERILLKHFLPPLVQQLEQDLRMAHSTPRSQLPLQAGDSVQHEFMSVLSHELRSPLSAIKGYTALLQAYATTNSSSQEDDTSLSPARQQTYLNSIMQQTEHLEVLLGDLFDISRMHTGHLALHCRPVKLISLCQQAIQIIQRRLELAQAHAENYTFHCVCPPDLPLAWADSTRVQQVLTNLLDNAVKYSPHGGSIELRVSASQLSDLLSISIQDHGMGIPPQQQSSLFKPFSRLKQTSARAIPGTGLGLYISRMLVQAMGGTINLASQPDQGTTITFTLPVEHTQSVSSSQPDAALASLV